MNKAVKKIPLMILIGFSVISTFVQTKTVEAFSDQIIQQGATGDDVVELQSRLQYIGFYKGTIDGVYGWGTYWSVKKYQDEFGLEVDGLVGENMKAMLEKSTKFDYEWVHKQFYEGRKFTHYGTTPKKIQSGPKGSKIPPLEQARRQEKVAEEAESPNPRSPEANPGTPPVPGVPTEETPATPGKEPAKPTPEVPEGEVPPGPGEAVEPPAEAVPTPAEGEPVPTEEPVTEGNPEDGPDIQEAINVPEGFSENEIRIMAQAVYGEARGEAFIGQVAVAAVILNRVNSPTFPNTASGVIFEPGAFTAVADGQIYMEPNETAKRAVIDAINGQDPSGNALYYFNPATATSGWIWSRPQIKKIGKHIFSK